jgi:hypothetical protein
LRIVEGFCSEVLFQGQDQWMIENIVSRHGVEIRVDSGGVQT